MGSENCRPLLRCGIQTELSVVLRLMHVKMAIWHRQCRDALNYCYSPCEITLQIRDRLVRAASPQVLTEP